MDHLEKTFSDMQGSCISFLRNNESVWIDKPVIKEDVEALEKNKQELDDTAKAQKESDPGGQIAQKRVDLLALAKTFYQTDRKLCHLAKKNNNMALLKTVDIPESAFLRGEEKEILLKFNAILTAVGENIEGLAAYNFTKDDKDALEARYAKLMAIPGAISVLTGNHKSATRSIKECNDEARLIFDTLDDAMEGMIDDQKYLEAWFDARKIKGRHIYKKADHTKTTDTKTPSK